MVVKQESAWTAPAAASARPASRIRKPRRRRPRWALGWRCMSKLLFVPADAEGGVLPGKRRTAPEHDKVAGHRRACDVRNSSCRSALGRDRFTGDGRSEEQTTELQTIMSHT